MHTDCLFAWLKVNKTCPLCKRDLKLELQDDAEDDEQEFEDFEISKNRDKNTENKESQSNIEMTTGTDFGVGLDDSNNSDLNNFALEMSAAR